jgi:hypothetical protein
MDEILDNLAEGEIIYTTRRNTNYLFSSRSADGGLRYSINQNKKTLPYDTIISAYDNSIIGIEINPQWYQNFNAAEYTSRPCNLSVLKALIARTQ